MKHLSEKKKDQKTSIFIGKIKMYLKILRKNFYLEVIKKKLRS